MAVCCGGYMYSFAVNSNGLDASMTDVSLLCCVELISLVRET